MSNSNINKLAKYIIHHVNNHGKYYGNFPVSNGYVFSAPHITKDNIYFHLEKNNHEQRIYVKINKTAYVDKREYYVTRYENTHIGEEPTFKIVSDKFTISDAKKLIKDLPKDDIVAYNQAFKILYPKL